MLWCFFYAFQFFWAVSMLIMLSDQFIWLLSTNVCVWVCEHITYVQALHYKIRSNLWSNTPSFSPLWPCCPCSGQCSTNPLYVPLQIQALQYKSSRDKYHHEVLPISCLEGKAVKKWGARKWYRTPNVIDIRQQVGLQQYLTTTLSQFKVILIPQYL